MKAVMFPARNEVLAGRLPDPVPGPCEVLVRVRASGICHTDLEVMRGNYGNAAYPLVPGHEYAGEIIACGAGVADVSPGARVVIDPNLECGACTACQRGWAHLCERLGAYGVTQNGGFAEMSVVRADRVHTIGEMSFAMAALAEPMGCVLNGLSPLAGRRIESATVVGAGPIGLLMALALKVRGAGDTVVVDLDEDRLDLAARLGVRGMHAHSAEAAGLARSSDLAVDATGVPEVAQQTIGYLANGGAALFFGVCPPSARIEISPFEVFRRQLAIFGTHSLNHNIPDALETIERIGARIEAVVTHRVDLDEIAGTMRTQMPRGSMKVQFVA